MTVFAKNVPIHAEYVDTENATVHLDKYHSDNQVTAVIIEYEHDGFPESLVVSVNLSSYNMFPPSHNHFFAPDYSQFQGIPESLEKAGIAQRIEQVKIGHGFGYLMKINDN